MKFICYVKKEIFTFLLCWMHITCAMIEKPMVIIIPSFNNARWYKVNLNSVFRQKYTNYRVVYIDDCSTDDTYELVQKYLHEHQLADRVVLVSNNKNVGALANLYNAIHQLTDTTIVVTVDGDDALANENVLSRVNEAYADPNVWMAYSQFIQWPSMERGWNKACSKESIDMATDRGLSPSHLRTFYAKLFKQIQLEDLLYEGEFFTMTWDMAIMLPMIEMARNDHVRFIPEVLYAYNSNNPISDHRKSRLLQQHLDDVIRLKKRYEPLTHLFD